MGDISFFIDLKEKLDGIGRSLARIERQLKVNLLAVKRGSEMAQQDIDALRVEVEKNTTVAQSAVTLINGLAQQLRDMADDPGQIRALADQLQQSSSSLGDAVAANTPTPPSP